MCNTSIHADNTGGYAALQSRVLAHVTSLQSSLGLLLFVSCSLFNLAIANRIDESHFFEEFPSVISASRLMQSTTNAPVAVTVIDRATIRASGFRAVADLLRLVPGFQVAYTSGSASVVTRNGFSDQFSRRIQVLIDGRSVYFSSTGGVFWRDLPVSVDDIQRIEVVRGPNAASYGSNSFLGVINIITQEALDSTGTRARIDIGNHNEREVYIRHSKVTDRTGLRVTGGIRKDEGFVDQTDSSRTSHATLRYQQALTPNDRIDFSFGISDGVRDVGFYDNVLIPTEDVKVTSHSVQLRWEHNLQPDNEISLQFYHAVRNERNRFLSEPISLGPLGEIEIPINEDLRDERYEIELQHWLQLHQDLRWVWGGGTRLDRVKSKTFFWSDPRLNYRLYRLFGHAEWSLKPDLLLNAGGMLEYNDITKMDFSPRLSLNYRPVPNHTLRLSYAKGIRTPALFEEYGDQRYYYEGVLLEQGILAPGDIKPETIESVSFSYMGLTQDRSTVWELRLFQDEIRDIIDNYQIDSTEVGPIDDDLITVENRGELTVRGIEASLTLHLGSDTELLFNHAVTDADGSGFGNEPVVNHTQMTVPDRTSSVLLTHRFTKGLDASLGYYAISDMRWDGNGSSIEAYQRIDFRLSNTFQANGRRGELSLVMQNLLGDYEEFIKENRFGRRAFLTLALEL